VFPSEELDPLGSTADATFLNSLFNGHQEGIGSSQTIGNPQTAPLLRLLTLLPEPLYLTFQLWMPLQSDLPGILTIRSTLFPHTIQFAIAGSQTYRRVVDEVHTKIHTAPNVAPQIFR
jgi:hypothetical protein